MVNEVDFAPLDHLELFAEWEARPIRRRTMELARP